MYRLRLVRRRRMTHLRKMWKLQTVRKFEIRDLPVANEY
jgi:hypothetical protein